jgi:hypothetical protein
MCKDFDTYTLVDTAFVCSSGRCCCCSLVVKAELRMWKALSSRSEKKKKKKKPRSQNRDPKSGPRNYQVSKCRSRIESQKARGLKTWAPPARPHLRLSRDDTHGLCPASCVLCRSCSGSASRFFLVDQLTLRTNAEEMVQQCLLGGAA